MIDTACADATPARVLAVIRWPVGGIRTWCRYVYCKPEFERFAIDIVMPRSHESAALIHDMADNGVAATVIETGPSVKSLAAAAVSRIMRGHHSLVHSHGFTSAVLSMLPARAMRIPHIVTVHEEVLPGQYRDFRGRWIRRAVNMALRSADCIHSVSYASRRSLLDDFPGAGRCAGGVQVISNGIDPTRFVTTRSDSVRDRLGLPAEAILVGFFGRFMAAKGFRYVIDAMKLHREVHNSTPDIAVLAVGGGGFRREDEQSVKRLGLESRFRFLDFMPNVAPVMKAVDVVVMPSLWEASGLLAMEALTAGVPLVVSDASGLKEVTANTPSRMFPVGNVGALLRAIIDMATSDQKAIAQAYGPTAARRFDVAETRRGIAALYESVMCCRSLGYRD